eukprot:1743070-Rhodomonas_salina.3
MKDHTHTTSGLRVGGSPIGVSAARLTRLVPPYPIAQYWSTKYCAFSVSSEPVAREPLAACKDRRRTLLFQRCVFPRFDFAAAGRAKSLATAKSDATQHSLCQTVSRFHLSSQQRTVQSHWRRSSSGRYGAPGSTIAHVSTEYSVGSA